MKEEIKKLRELTGLGISDCKKALEEASGDLDKALDILKKRGAQILEKKSSRIAHQGVIDSYIHFSQELGAMVEVNCETDFVARTEDFRKFVKDIALHIAASSPKYINREEVPSEILEGLTEEEKEEYFKKNCLLEQPFIKDESLTIKDYLNSLGAKVGEKVVIRRFVRFSLREDED